MPNGYNGKILHVDLTKGSLTVEEPKDAFYRKYLGGSAMGMHYILRDMPKGADALSPENVLTLFTGVTTGAAISGQSRLNANAKSPISGGIGDSQSGGFFPAELKFAGFDGIVAEFIRHEEDGLRFAGSGLVILNPPWQFETTAAALQAELREALGAPAQKPVRRLRV